MNGNLRIYMKNSEYETTDLTMSPTSDDKYELSITLGDDETVEDVLKGNRLKKELLEMYKMNINFNMYENKEDYNLLKKGIKGEIDYVNTIDLVMIFMPFKEVDKFIKCNEFLQDKKIILDEVFALNKETLLSIESSFEDTSNILVNLEGNNEAVTIEEYKQTLELVYSLVSKVEQYDFSPFEQLIYVYDLVRDRIYKSGDETEAIGISRSLTSVLLGEKIVCAGFSAIFQAILNKLGIKNLIQSLDVKNEENGHARNIVFLKDEKYNIEGIYLFDTTWDSKRKNQDNNFLYSYQYFAKTKDFFEKNVENYIDKTFANFNSNSYIDYKEILDNKGIMSSKELLTLNKLSYFVDDIRIVDPQMHHKMGLGIKPEIPFDQHKILKYAERYSKLINSSISAETFLDALLVVREKQNLENEDKYPLSIDALYNISVKSKFEFINGNAARLLNFIFGEEINTEKELKDSFIKYARDTDLINKLEGTKVKTKNR